VLGRSPVHAEECAKFNVTGLAPRGAVRHMPDKRLPRRVGCEKPLIAVRARIDQECIGQGRPPILVASSSVSLQSDNPNDRHWFRSDRDL
jgi:hypothetical protein